MTNINGSNDVHIDTGLSAPIMSADKNEKEKKFIWNSIGV